MNTNTCQLTVIIVSTGLLILFCAIFPFLTWFHQLAVLAGVLGVILFMLLLFLYYECCMPEKQMEYGIELVPLPEIVVVIDPDDSIRVGVYKTEETIEND